MKKKLLIGVSIVVGVLLITVVGLGLLLDANQFRPRLEAMMSESLGRTATMAFPVQKLRIAGGQIVIGGRNEVTRTYDDVNVDVTDLSYSSQFPFHVTAKMPGGGTLTLGGHAGPFNAKDAAETPFDATV